MNKKFSIPSRFELLNDNEVHNTNFKKVKLYIQSDGVNYNKTSFTVDSMQNAMSTIDYIPILGYVKDNGDAYDFDEHNVSYDIHVDSNGETSILENFEEIPIGVVTSKDCHIEYGDKKNYLVAYGYIWKSYSNRGIEILERDMEKEVSMEILVFDGDFNDEGVFAISKYEIQGVTVLGQDVPAGIEGSKIQMCFSKNKEYEDNLKEIDKLLASFSLKGGDDVEENKQEFEQQEGVQTEEQVEPQQQEFAEKEKEEVCENCGKNPCECEKENDEEFSEKENEEEEEKEEERKYSQSEYDEAIAKVQAELDESLVYAKSLKEELETLREFKAEYDRQVKEQQLNNEMDEIVTNFNVEDELVKELKEKVMNGEYSMEKFELELFRNNQPVKKEFSKKEQSNKLPVIDNEVKMSDVDAFFNKYNVPKRK